MKEILIPHWPWIALRGVAALIFGIFSLFYPEITVTVLVVLFGVFVLADGILTVIWAFAYRRLKLEWLPTLIGGLVEIGIGVFTIFAPRITAIVLLYIIAAWAIIFGITQIVAGIRLRRLIRGEWLLILAGALSILFGSVLFLFPGAGVLAVVIWIGIYAIVMGVLLIALALKLRSWNRTIASRM